MQVFYLTTEFPWPAASGGAARTLSQLRTIASLSEVDAITLLSVTERAISKAEVSALAMSFWDLGATKKLRVVPHLPPDPPLRLQALRPQGAGTSLARRAVSSGQMELDGAEETIVSRTPRSGSRCPLYRSPGHGSLSP